MFSLHAIASANRLVLSLTGSVNEQVVPEIGKAIDSRRHGGERVALDLSEVTLIDRVAARFFAEQVGKGIELVDCPSYLERWILREVENEEPNRAK